MAEITNAFELTPTESFSKGELFGSMGRQRRQSAWLLSTRALVTSKDGRRHLAWLLDHLGTKEEALERLRQSHAEMDISCYYVSVGQGGPTMSAEQMAELGRLGLDVWWDIYFDSSD